MIHTKPEITDSEKTIVKATSSLIFVIRSSFSIHNFVITSSYETRSSSNVLIYPLYLQDKTIALSKLEITIQGTVLVASHPLNLHLVNLDVNLARSAGGFDITALCGYPEAALDGLVYISNFTLHFGSEREISSFKYWPFRYIGPAAFEATDLTVSIFTLSAESTASFYIQPDSSCVPATYRRFYNFTNLNMVQSFSSGDLNIFSSNVNEDIYVMNYINIINLNIESTIEEYILLYFLGSFTLNMYFNNITAIDCGFDASPIAVVLFSKVEINNVTIESSILNAQAILYFDYATELKIRNLKMNNVSAYGETDQSMFFVKTLPYGIATIDEWRITNSEIKYHDFVYFGSYTSGSLVVSNLHVSETLVGSMILKASSLNSFQVTNSSFTDLTRYENNDKEKYVIYIDEIDLIQYGAYMINDIISDNSDITFFTLTSIISNSVVGQKLELSSIQVTNYYSEFNRDIILFESLETNSDFEIILSDFTFSNITYANSGNLCNFGQQTPTPLVLKNCYFHDLYGAHIYLGSFNLANQDLLTNVKMINVTTANISSNSKSFIVNNEGGYLEISNSMFRNMDNFESGSVITGGYQNSQTLIYNSTFTNNTSIYGGVAYVHSGSVIKFYD